MFTSIVDTSGVEMEGVCGERGNMDGGNAGVDETQTANPEHVIASVCMSCDSVAENKTSE